MKLRKFWLQRINEEWKRHSLIWLSGVRRTGKTFLTNSLNDIEYFDCELPRIRSIMEDPEQFLNSLQNKKIILDEIHRLKNPSELLKIATDHYPNIKIIATGSSTLQASTKFKDTLVGRKSEIWLTPMISNDLEDFGNKDLSHRFLHGGLPSFFLYKTIPERDFQEWMDGYWAKDIQELFRLEKRFSFQKFLELLFINSGGIFEATKYANSCEVSRTTITNYLNVLESTFVAHIIKPYSTHKQNEIISAPKVYGFDTGFVCYYRGWYQLRPTDIGNLWEHYVLNEIQAKTQNRNIYYWRDKRGHEIDFIYIKRGSSPMVLECKWSSVDVDIKNILSFRRNYPNGKNYIITNDVRRPFYKTKSGIRLEYIGLDSLIKKLTSL
jgi:predicted AAA+ superfamily ATPase